MITVWDKRRTGVRDKCQGPRKVRPLTSLRAASHYWAFWLEDNQVVCNTTPPINAEGKTTSCVSVGISQPFYFHLSIVEGEKQCWRSGAYPFCFQFPDLKAHALYPPKHIDSYTSPVDMVLIIDRNIYDIGGHKSVCVCLCVCTCTRTCKTVALIFVPCT